MVAYINNPINSKGTTKKNMEELCVVVAALVVVVVVGVVQVHLLMTKPFGKPRMLFRTMDCEFISGGMRHNT